MLEFFRKYSAFAFIVLIILFFGLIFMVDGIGSAGGLGGGPKRMSIDGQGYSYNEVNKEGSKVRQLFINLLRERIVDPMVQDYAITIVEFKPYSQQFQTDDDGFLANRLTLQSLIKNYGIEPDQEYIEKVIKEKLFIDQDGNFRAEDYSAFIENSVNRYGLSVQHLNDLVGEMIGLEKLKKITGSGLTREVKIVDQAIRVNGQTVSYSSMLLPLDKLRETIEVTDEGVQLYWEEHKNNYLTEPQVKVQYALVDAGIDKLQKEYEDKLKNKARAEGKSEEEIAKLKVTLPTAEKAAPLRDTLVPLEALFLDVQNEGAPTNFETKAAELGLKLTTTEFFTQSTAPSEFIGKPTTNALELIVDSTSLKSISKFHTVSEGKYLLFRLLDRVDAEPLPFDQAKDRARNDFIESKLSESLETQTEQLRVQLVDAAKEGKLKQKAEEIGMTYSEVTDANRSSVTGDYNVFLQNMTTKLNEVSEPIINDFSVSFVYPTKREYINDPAQATTALITRSHFQTSFNDVVFYNWFYKQKSALDFQRFETPSDN